MNKRKKRNYIRFCADIEFETEKTAEEFSKEAEIIDFFTDIKVDGNSVSLSRNEHSWKEERSCADVLRENIGKTLRRFKNKIRKSDFQIVWLSHAGISRIKFEELV